MVSHGTGKTCSLQFPSGLQTNVAVNTVKLGAGTNECIFKASFTEGDATLVVQVP